MAQISKVNFIVAKTSPNLYAAAQQAGLGKEGINQIEQYSWTVDKNKQLSRLKIDDARKEYMGLDTKVQEMIKFLYPNAEYTKEAPDIVDHSLKILKTATIGMGNPLVLAFKTLGSWNRLINTPYLMARQAAQGEGLFNSQTFTDAWDGRRVYDNGALAETVKAYGTAKVEVAKGFLAGKTPGEIIQSYGTVDDSLLTAIKEAYNDEDSFKAVLKDVKYAQVSPGRDIARAAFGSKIGDVDWRVRASSTVIDMMYQIVVDPLSWATGGTGKLAAIASRVPIYGEFVKYAGKTDGDRLVKSITEHGTLGVREAFDKTPSIRNHWDNEIGPAVKDFIAAKGEHAKGQAFRAISSKYEGHNNREWIDLLARNNVIDAESAIKYFGEDIDAARMLLAGRVDGVQYFRNGIATSRNQRRMAGKLASKINDFLNPKYGEEAGDKAWAALTKVGPADNALVHPEIKQLEEFYKGISRKEKISRAAGRTPQNRSIRIGDRAIETADIFYDTARQILPADLADMVTYKFINAAADEQVQVLRSLYYGIMQKAGLAGHPKGDELIKKTLDVHFGSKEGLSVVDTLNVPKSALGVIKGAGLKVIDDVVSYETSGIIHPHQEAKAIGNLDYQLIAQTAYEIKTKKNLLMTIQGASQQKLASEFVNFWSIFTLFPRLGIRSAIDEGVLFMLTAPARDIWDVITLKGHRMGKVATAATASRHTEGFRAKIRAKLGRENVADTLDIDTRKAIRYQVAEEKGVSVDMVRNIDMALATAQAAGMKIPHRLEKEEWELFTQALAHNSHLLSGSAASIVARASLTSRPSQEIAEQLITLNNYELMLKESDIVTNRVGALIDTRDLAKATALGTEPIAKVHYENFVRRFYGNGRVIKGTEEKRFLNPVAAFMDNNGLLNEQDWHIAIDTLLRQVGIGKAKALQGVVGKETFDALDSKLTYVVDDVDALADFLTMSARSTELRQRGISDIEIAKDQVNRILLDMYTTFHGSANNFNAELMKKLISNRKKLVKQPGDKVDWNDAMKSLTFDDFLKVTKGMQPEGKMFTLLDIEGLTDTESIIKKLGNNAMEVMDNQVTGILRQPVIMVSYLRIRKNYAQFEKQEYDLMLKAKRKEFEQDGIRETGIKYGKTTHLDAAKDDINELINKKYTEIAIQQAADTVLKFADNPNIRTNFALSVRNVGRFYRATEDFWRRVYRMKDVKLRAVYRMRLAHVGMDAAGDIYQDSNGEPYIMMPMDDIIFGTIDTIVKTFNPEAEPFKQPLFNDFTFKLTLSNPSFSPDAGRPALSGPIGALSVLGMKSILGQFGTPGKQVAEELDNWALGSMGEGVTAVRAVIPASLQKVYAMLPVNEKNRQEATAAMQAIAYNAAAGIAPGPNATPEERAAYLKGIRISAHNVMFMRAALGLLSPITATTQESKGVPDYLLNVGITGLRPEFYDLVNAITQRYGGDVQNPYDLAVATFVGQNPDKIIYTVSRQDKNVKVLINKTKETKDWFIANKGLYDTYGEAAFIFAPNTGDFDASSYAWMEAAGFIKNKELEQYYLDVTVSRDKQAYFNIARWEKEALSNSGQELNRKNIINSATAQRARLKASNPLLEAAITGTGNEIASEQIMLSNLQGIITNTDVSMPEGTRNKLLILVNQLNGFTRLSTDPEIRNSINFTDIKRQRKAEIEALINRFIEGDAIVKEANRAIFTSILDYYSRDTYSATLGRTY